MSFRHKDAGKFRAKLAAEEEEMCATCCKRVHISPPTTSSSPSTCFRLHYAILYLLGRTHTHAPSTRRLCSSFALREALL